MKLNYNKKGLHKYRVERLNGNIIYLIQQAPATDKILEQNPCTKLLFLQEPRAKKEETDEELGTLTKDT